MWYSYTISRNTVCNHKNTSLRAQLQQLCDSGYQTDAEADQALVDAAAVVESKAKSNDAFKAQKYAEVEASAAAGN